MPKWLTDWKFLGAAFMFTLAVGAWLVRAEQIHEAVPKLEQAVQDIAESRKAQADALDNTLNLCRAGKIDPNDIICQEAFAEYLRTRKKPAEQ